MYCSTDTLHTIDLLDTHTEMHSVFNQTLYFDSKHLYHCYKANDHSSLMRAARGTVIALVVLVPLGFLLVCCTCMVTHK